MGPFVEKDPVITQSQRKISRGCSMSSGLLTGRSQQPPTMTTPISVLGVYRRFPKELFRLNDGPDIRLREYKLRRGKSFDILANATGKVHVGLCVRFNHCFPSIRKAERRGNGRTRGQDGFDAQWETWCKSRWESVVQFRAPTVHPSPPL